MGVLGKHIGSEVQVLKLDVEQEEVAERLLRMGWVLQQEVELAAARCEVLLDAHESLVVERDGVELLLRTRRHVVECLARRLYVPAGFHRVLDRSFEVDSLHQSGVFEDLGIANTSHIHPLGIRAHAQLWVLTHASLDDLGDMLESWAELAHLIVAESDIVRQVGLEASGVHCLSEPLAGQVELAFFVRHATAAHDRFRVVWEALVGEGLAGAQVVLLVLDHRLQLGQALRVLGVIGMIAGARSLRVQPRFVQGLRKVDLVLLHVGEELGELLIHAHRVRKVLYHIVAVCEKRQRRARAGEVLQLQGEFGDHIRVFALVNEGVNDLRVVALRDLVAKHHGAAAPVRGGHASGGHHRGLAALRRAAPSPLRRPCAA
mmetsp:Transcript_210/g.713  ORF Transcript_210/g.713 Transcript_210/m.713 type:complete len:375 (+) Transcript_210:1131-2255(+)